MRSWGQTYGARRPKTKILVDGGDPQETQRIKALLGFVDGQTTNPTLIAKNPEIRQFIASGHRLSSREENEEYKKIVQKTATHDIGPIIDIYRADVCGLAPLLKLNTWPTVFSG